MKSTKFFYSLRLYALLLMLSTTLMGLSQDVKESADFVEFSGEVLDSETRDALVFADIEVQSTNIRTVTNTDGELLLKVPREYLGNNVVIIYLGYQRKTIPLSEMTPEDNEIFLMPLVTELSAINIKVPKDAQSLVRKMLEAKDQNYLDQNTLMTAFYRETIKKRRQNASLAEAVVEVYKQPYSSTKKDRVKLIKSRKSTNYSKLDTIALKLQGGPFNTLYSDLIKYPEFIFTDENFEAYNFQFEQSTTIDNNQVFVVSFRQKPEIITPLYYGRLYIDAENYALNSAVYNLNLENEELAADYFVERKPRRVKVYPTEAAYRVDYKTKNSKWYYAYSNLQLTFKVDWKGKLFNSVYSLQSEMVITDWEVNNTDNLKSRDQISPTVIMADEASGFADPDFWGEYNIIEPEKSIEQAIRKINRNIDRSN